MSPQPLADLTERASAVLQAGHRLWLVGGSRFSQPGGSSGSLPPAPNSPFGWDNVAYTRAWSKELGDFIQTHTARVERIPLRTASRVNAIENVSVILVEGWR